MKQTSKIREQAFELIILFILAAATVFAVSTNWENLVGYAKDPTYWKYLAGAIFLLALYAFRHAELTVPSRAEKSSISHLRLPPILFQTVDGHSVEYSTTKQAFFCDGKKLTISKPWTAAKVVENIEPEWTADLPFVLEKAPLGKFQYKRGKYEETFTGGPELIHYHSGHFEVVFSPDELSLRFSIKQPKAMRVGQP